ncbi:MAG: FAD-dependent oxidoreductase [Pseudomonadota bacterium]
MNDSNQRPILVLGAGIAGITTALEAAEAGAEVILVEREQAVGGRVLRIHNYFPKLCPPTCGTEINVRRLEKNPRIRLLTGAQVTAAERQPDGWSVTVTQSAQYVKDSCTLCGECSKVCPAKVPDPNNLGMVEVPAIRLPHSDAFPRRYAIDRGACPDGCKACVDACKYDAIDLAAEGTVETFAVKSMVVATGWTPYPLDKLHHLGGGVFDDVIANVALERLAAPAGPTGGKILRPSDGQAPKRVAFVQCAGSRDVNHLPYCSGVCCLASLKQSLYVREQLPDAEITMYYIDRRAPGRNEAMLVKAEEAGVTLVKGKVGRVKAGPDGSLLLRFEDQDKAQLVEAEADLVVLATGMVPNGIDFDGITLDDDGFAVDDHGAKVFVAGVARRPEDVAASVRDATGAAAKSLFGGRIS